MTKETLTARASIRIRRAPEKVFAAFADGGQMSRFWFSRQDDRLREGEDCQWSLGSGDDAFTFDVRVKTVTTAARIVIEWPGPDGNFTQVEWRFEEADGDTILTIEETGFAGDADAIVARVIDSTGGFNQVCVAAKAWVEHGKAINVVADHA